MPRTKILLVRGYYHYTNLAFFSLKKACSLLEYKHNFSLESIYSIIIGMLIKTTDQLKPSMLPFISKRPKLSFFIAFLLILGISGYFFLPGFIKSNSTEIARTSLSIIKDVSKILPIQADTKKEIAVLDQLTQALTEKNGRTWVFLILLQNNAELRPGGGFLGQYAIIKIKDGAVVSQFVEDANLLDQRIVTKVTPPWPLTKYMQIRSWKFRDSNFSPDFLTNAAKAEYFYRLAGGHEKFDGVFALDSNVFDDALALTGPIQIPGYPGTYSSDGGSLKLEEAVEKAYLGDDVPAEMKQNRKSVMKRIAEIMIGKLVTVDNIPKLAELGLNELRDKNVMLSFKDAALQSAVESVYWDGSIAKDWDGDYLMVVDANMGALKTDYYIKRSINYLIDFTTPKPTATLTYTYDHTATHGDWRTSDYHTYVRVLTPVGSKYVEGSRVKTSGVSAVNDAIFKKNTFSYKVDALIGQTLPTSIQYELPDTITADKYQLLIQKQSGTGDIPVKVTLKTNDGEFSQEATLKKDIRFSFAKAQ